MSDLCRDGILLAESGEQFVQRQDEVVILGEETDLIEQFEPNPPATPLQPFWTPRHNDFGPQCQRCRAGVVR